MHTQAPKRALVLFSGGQDSTTCLAWALDRYDWVETVGFDYRQRHRIELTCRGPILAAIGSEFSHWRAKLGADHVLDLGVLGTISESALTREMAIEFAANALPNTFVPGRNLLFLTLAAALAYRGGLEVVVAGMCETDFSGYPDCREATIKALEHAVHLGMDRRFEFATPLMRLDKRQTWQLAQTLGGEKLLAIVRDLTHTCYLGERGTKHAWGYGCGACPACELRKVGYQEFSAQPH